MKIRRPMTLRDPLKGRAPLVLGVVLLQMALFSGIFAVAAQNDAAGEKLFATPEDAMQALVDAAKTKDQAALTAIFGPARSKLLSGDPVEDNNALQHFSENLEKSAKLAKVDDARFTLQVGEENYPFPIPIVKQGDQWRYDTKAGMEEILNREIGENELSAIMTCRAYVLAQWEYFTQALDTSKDGLAVYAQKFISTPGKHDGLYWDTAEGEKPSPLGSLVAEAREEGYSAGRTQSNTGGNQGAAAHERPPFHGYYFKILTRQGQHSPGGSFSYIINGNMIAGYALIAYPDKWGSSGIMSFIVNNQGRVYEKNFGPKTAQIAGAITEYDPDSTWKPVKE
ncbi:MAG TPA: DUF2950 domain-containing protein [Terriglobales bacterium]|jgi:hypothetical protein|nr:DUF2950 domain-containing protein [Terriglobales bacterium]